MKIEPPNMTSVQAQVILAWAKAGELSLKQTMERVNEVLGTNITQLHQLSFRQARKFIKLTLEASD